MPSLSNNDLQIIITAVDRASKDLDEVKRKISGLGEESERSANKVSRVGQAVVALGGIARTAAVALAAMVAAVVTACVSVGIGFNSAVEQATAKLTAFMKDGNKVADTLAWVKSEAAQTQFSFTDMANAAANLTPVAKQSGQSLEGLVRQAEVLAALNPEEGLTGAAFALREALSGDWVSIVERFNLPRLRINQLKDQGVPAMEIISRTLGEMGIDYSLVAAQGQTLSARFDQVKDKLTMMAGAASKPIFDRISKEFDKIGQIDFNAIGVRMAGVVDSIINRWDALGKQASDYLGPKLADFKRVFDEELSPALGKFWHEVLEPLNVFITTVFIVGLGLLIDTLKSLASWMATAYTTIRDGLGRLRETLQPGIDWFMQYLWPPLKKFAEWIQKEWSDAVGIIKSEWEKFSKTMKDAGINIDVVQIALFGILTVIGKLMAPLLILTAAVIGIGLAFAELVKLIKWCGDKLAEFSWNAAVFILKVVDKFNELKDGAVKAWNFIKTMDWGAALSGVARGIGNSIIGMIEGAINGALKGLPGSPRVSIPRFARGTNFAPGGLALVGEEGPELVNLPRGSQVKTASETRQALSRGSGPQVNVTQHIYNQVDYARGWDEINFRLRGA